MSLSPDDRAAVEALPFDPSAEVMYHEILGCLVWSDELPDDITSDGLSYLRDLLGIRGAIHRGEDADLDTWNLARMTGLRWNGFQRLVLTEEQRAALDRYRNDDREL